MLGKNLTLKLTPHSKLCSQPNITTKHCKVTFHFMTKCNQKKEKSSSKSY